MVRFGICLLLFILTGSYLYTEFLCSNDEKINIAITPELYEAPLEIEIYNSEKVREKYELKHIPQRVIAVEANNLESLLALGVADKIVGAEFSTSSERYKRFEDKYPVELAKIKNISNLPLDLEATLWLQPDCILGWKSTFNKTYLRSTFWWKRRGVLPYIVATLNKTIPHGTIQDEFNYIRDMGKLFHKEEKAENIINSMKTFIFHIKEETKGRKKPRVLVIEEMGKDLANYDRNWLVGDMVEQLGGDYDLPGTKYQQRGVIGIESGCNFCCVF